MSLSKLKTIDSYFQVQTKKFDLKEIVKVIINDIFVAAMCDQQKHASASDKTYAVWKELFPWIVTDFVIDSEDPSQHPVILTDTNLVSSALHWDVNYLANHIGDGKFTVYKSHSHKFKYYSDKKCKMAKQFIPPTEQHEMTFGEFVTLLREKQKEKHSNEKVYLQQALNDTIGKTIVYDFVNFNWSWLNEQQKLNNWGALTSNLLLVGMAGNVTPVHYDEQENFFAQIYGKKRFMLFHPDHFENLYPYPVFHPHDRQSQVDLENIDYDRFPNAHNLSGYEGIVGPGDVLYIPMYWWHEVESLGDVGETISVNFWYISGSVEKVEHPLTGQQKVAMTRNIEKMILQALNDPNEVPPFMRMLVLGRYT